MYPRWRYKKGEVGMVSVIIFDLEQEKRLGGEWFDTPAELEASKIILEEIIPILKKRSKK